MDGRRARGGAQDEQRRDHSDVQNDDLLEGERVGDLQEHERQPGRGRTETEAPARARARRRAASAEAASALRAEQGAARDRTEPLHGMQPVAVGVADVVDQVGGARGEAEGGERGSRLQPAAPVAEPDREQQPGEEQQVLQPLANANRRRDQQDAAAPHRADELWTRAEALIRNGTRAEAVRDRP